MLLEDGTHPCQKCGKAGLDGEITGSDRDPTPGAWINMPPLGQHPHQ